MEPNIEAITKWVEALESEEFQGRQVRNAMVKDDGMCAIGVRNYVYIRSCTYLTPNALLILSGQVSDQASHWVGVAFDETIGETASGTSFDVIYANDNLGMTFPEIAQHLRKKYL